MTAPSTTGIIRGMSQIGSISDIARDQGVTRDAVNKWSKLHADFPGPVQESAVGRLYDLAAVRKWAAKKGLPKSRGA